MGVILLSVSMPMFGQRTARLNFDNLFNQVYTGTRVYSGDLSKVQGSQFRNENFVQGKIRVLGGNSMLVPLRYNAFKDVFQVKQDNGELSYVNRSRELFFELGNETYKIFRFNSEGKILEEYFIILTNGGENFTFLLRPRKAVAKGKPPRDGFTPATPSKFIEIEEYYLKNGMAAANPINLKKKEILNQLSDKKKEVETFAKKNKLSYKKPKDVAKIIAHYNTISSSAQ